MRENIFIAILLVIITAVYSLVLVNVYGNTKAAEDTAEYAAVSEDGVSPDEAAYLTEKGLPGETEGFWAAAAKGQAPADTDTKAEVKEQYVPEEQPVTAVQSYTIPEQVYHGDLLVRPSVSTDGLSAIKLWAEDKDDDEDEVAAPQPVNIIIDLDYNSDVDDTAALRVAAILDRMGRIRLKAAMASTGGDKVCKALHAQLSYDGYGSVPIGKAVQDVPGGSPYWDDLISHYFTAGDYRLYNSVELYKQVLRELDRQEKEKEKERKRYKEKFECKDDELPEELKEVEKLRIVTTGYLVNVAGLLQDPEGYSLVSRYVDSIWITGGIYLQGDDHNFVVTKACADAARYVLSASPVGLVFSSSASVENEDGNVIFCGSGIQYLDKNGTDPVAMAYRDYAKANNTSLVGGRNAWDPFCLWAASLTLEETNLHLEAVNMMIGDSGYNIISYELPPNCRIIRRNSTELGWYTAQLEGLINAGYR